MRPVLLIVDDPEPDKLSTSKLVLETAKFNVLNASSVDEAIDILSRLDLHGVILQGSRGQNCEELLQRLRNVRPATKVLVPEGTFCTADRQYPLFDPGRLVAICRELFGDPVRIEIDQIRICDRSEPAK